MLEGWTEAGNRITDLLVPTEFNHEVFPLASTALDPAETLLTHTVTTLLPDGRYVERTLEVEGSPRLGLPGLFDQEVYAGIMALTERQGGMPEDGRIRFSLYELKEILGLSTNAKTYRRLRDSLLRWQRTSLTTQGAIYLADAEEYAHAQAYNIWAVQWARDSRPGRAKIELNEVKFHEYFIRNYRANYYKSIDWDFWLSLGRGKRGGTLKRLYRLIDAERAGTLQWCTTVQNLMSQVPVPPSYKYPGKAKDFVQRHHNELVERGFLRSVHVDDDYGVHYEVDPRFVNRQRHLGLAGDPRERAAIERLMSFKVREKAARRLVGLRGADTCQRYMDALPHQKNVRNGAGWLKSYIEGDANGPFPPKDGFAPLQTRSAGGKGAARSISPAGKEARAPKVDATTPPNDLLPDPQPTPSLVEDVARRHEAGEFDDAIEAFRGAPHSQYIRYVDTRSPVKADDTDNLYYVSLSGDLYLCLRPDSVAEEHRAYIATLARSAQQNTT